jgi:hypothetical protein
MMLFSSTSPILPVWKELRTELKRISGRPDQEGSRNAGLTVEELDMSFFT